MRRGSAGLLAGLLLVACTVGATDTGLTGPGLGVATSDGATATEGTNGGSEGPGSASASGEGTSADGSSGGGPGATTGACVGMPGSIALGGACMDPCDCASGHCFTISLGSACSECTNDGQCMAGGVGTCSADFTLDPPYARCTGGELGVMCEPGSTGCQAGLVCAQIINTAGFLPDYFCSQCATSADCTPGNTCVPVVEYGGLAIAEGSLQCVPPSSLPNGELCPVLPAGAGDGSVCVSGRCAVTDVGGLGIVDIGVCSPCAIDGDCAAGQACTGASVDENGTTPAMCG